MKKIVTMIVSAVLLGALALTGAVGCGSNKTEISIGGSSSIAPLMEVLAEEFSAKNSQYKITVNSVDSGNGIQGAKDGTYWIGLASKTVADAELESTVICKDGIAVIVNSGVSDIEGGDVTKDALASLYLDGTAISATVKNSITREAASGTRDAFDGKIGLKDKTLKSSELNTTGAVISKVESDKSSLGYASLGSVDKYIKAGKKIQKLKINGVEATSATVLDGSYLISRDFTLLTKKGALEITDKTSDSDKAIIEGVKKLFDFIKSADGKAIMEEEGYINL